jgi:hypothetical protein
MKADPKTQKAREAKLRDAVTVLMEYGLPDPRFWGIVPDAEINLRRIGIPIDQPGHAIPGIDLTAMDPSKILLAMFKRAWEAGFEAGTYQAEDSHTSALLEAFPKLKDTIREIANEVATKQIDELKLQFSR